MNKVVYLDPEQSIGQPDSCYYFSKNNALYMKKETQQKVEEVPLSNFAAQIVEEQIHDDGAETKRYFCLEGTLGDGSPLPEIVISAEQFTAMKWPVQHWGSRVVIYPGKKEHLRAAIQVLSGDVTRTAVYAHSGWKQIGGQWVYLHGAGGIGAAGPTPTVNVELQGKLADYQLPEPPQDNELKEAVRASLAVLHLAPEPITTALLASVYRAPLGELLANDFSIFVCGPSGSQKTELTALAQAHYGAGFSGRNLPGNWASTGNALERQAFFVKDAVFVVDDFAPVGSTADVNRLHREAERLLRAQGNRAGRSRMTLGDQQKPEYHPRGLVIASGEDVPRGQSLQARLLILESSSGCVDLEKLTEAQQRAAEGVYAQAMAGYLKWLAQNMELLEASLPKRHQELRYLVRTSATQHDRTPDIQANLALGFEMFLEYAHEAGVLTADEKAALWQNAFRSLESAANAQASSQSAVEPANRFVELLRAAFAVGRAHLVDGRTGGVPENSEQWGWQANAAGGSEKKTAQGKKVGWLLDGKVLLEPESVFQVVTKFADEQQEPLSVNKQTLWRRVKQKGYLASTAPDKNVAYRTVQGRRRYVLHLSGHALSPETGTVGTTGAEPLEVHVAVPETCAR